MVRAPEGEKGIALILVLGVLSLLLILALTFAFNMRIEQKAAANYLDFVTADMLAQAGVNYAVAELRSQSVRGFYHDDSLWPGGTHTVTVTSDGIPIGRFTVEVTDESGGLNINHAGNLSAAGAHGQNEGWSAYEISIADVLEAAGLAGYDDTARDIIRFRYGGSDAGTNPYFDVRADGVDNDASGDIDQAGERDPLWFSPWNPRTGHRPFITAGHLYMVAAEEDWAGDWDSFWTAAGPHLTAHSRSSSGTNINVLGPEWFLHAFFRQYPRDTIARFAVNAVDYRDSNHAVSSLTTANSFYGVESVLINEVLANSYTARDEGLNLDSGTFGRLVNARTGLWQNAIETFRLGGFSPGTAYRARIWAEDDELEVRMGGDVDWRGGADWIHEGDRDMYFLDYPLGANSLSDADGWIFIQSRPIEDQESVDIPPEAMDDYSTTMNGDVFSVAASGEYSPAWHAFDEVVLTYWGVQGNLEDKELPPSAMSGRTTVIDGVSYTASASGYTEGREPWRAFGPGYWEVRSSPETERFPPAPIGSSNVMTYGGITYTASALPSEEFAYRVFDRSHSTYYRADIEVVRPGTPVADFAGLDAVRGDLDGHYYMTADIAIPAGVSFEPLGTEAQPFTGTFDGWGYEITNLVIDRPGQDNVGLFGYTGDDAGIFNLTLTEIDVRGRERVGGLAGVNRGTVSNVRLRMQDRVFRVEGDGYVGGLAGRNFGEVSDAGVSGADVRGGDFTGGLIGENLGQVRKSHSSSSAYGDETFVTGADYVGGLIGGNAAGGAVEDSFSKADVAGDGRVGGLIGRNNGSAERTYSAGPVQGTVSFGGLIGSQPEGVTNESFWDTETSGLAVSAGGEGKTTGQMLDRGTYTDAGWNFDDAGEWRMAAPDFVVYDSDERELLTGLILGDTCLETSTGDTYMWLGDYGWVFLDYDWPNGGYPYLSVPILDFEIAGEVWVQLDLGQEEEISELRISNYPGHGVHNFSLEARNSDGDPWNVVKMATAGDYSGWQDFSFPSEEYRYWRVVMHSAYDRDELRIRQVDLGRREYEAWISLDIGERRTVHEMLLSNVEDYGVKDFILQGSRDGADWVDIFSGTADDDSSVQSFEIDPSASYRHWRLFANTVHHAGGRLRISSIRYVTGELDPPEWIDLDMGEPRMVHSIEIRNAPGHGAGDFRVYATNADPPPPDTDDWVPVYSGSAANTDTVQRFSFGEKTYRNWRLEVVGAHDAGADIRIREIKYIGGDACTIEEVEFVCAEFIELVNTGGGDIPLGGWEVETEPGIRRSLPASSIESGGYLVLTNDEELFSLSYPVAAGGALEVPGWRRYEAPTPFVEFSLISQFPDEGDFDILFYEDAGELAALAVSDASVPDSSWPGNSGMTGRSREKNDPAVRTGWFDSVEDEHGATPGEHNTRISPAGESRMDDIKAGNYPPLVKNGMFATIAELDKTDCWETGQVKYAGVARPAGSGDHWDAVGESLPDFLERMVARVSMAGYCMRFDAPGMVGSYSWPEARLDANHGRSDFTVYLYDDRDRFVAALDGGDCLGDNGALEVDSAENFAYVLVVPGSIPGRVNVNTASREVLLGLPGMGLPGSVDTLADDVIDNRIYRSMPRLLRVLDAAGFAPVANIVAVDSDVFRVVSTGITLDPMGRSAAEKSVEAVIDRGGGEVKIISWRILGF